VNLHIVLFDKKEILSSHLSESYVVVVAARRMAKICEQLHLKCRRHGQDTELGKSKIVDRMIKNGLRVRLITHTWE